MHTCTVHQHTQATSILLSIIFTFPLADSFCSVWRASRIDWQSNDYVYGWNKMKRKKKRNEHIVDGHIWHNRHSSRVFHCVYGPRILIWNIWTTTAAEKKDMYSMFDRPECVFVWLDATIDRKEHKKHLLHRTRVQMGDAFGIVFISFRYFVCCFMLLFSKVLMETRTDECWAISFDINSCTNWLTVCICDCTSSFSLTPSRLRNFRHSFWSFENYVDLIWMIISIGMHHAHRSIFTTECPLFMLPSFYSYQFAYKTLLRNKIYGFSHGTGVCRAHTAW